MSTLLLTLSFAACGGRSDGTGPQRDGWDSGTSGAPPVGSVVYVDKSIDFRQVGTSEQFLIEDENGDLSFLSSWTQSPFAFSHSEALEFIKVTCDENAQNVSILYRRSDVLVKWANGQYGASIGFLEVLGTFQYQVFCFKL